MTATQETESVIPDFDDKPVAKSGITIAGLGATFGSTLNVEPVVFHKGDEVFIMLRAKCVRVSFPDDKDGNQVRVHHLHSVDASWGDPDYAKKFLAEDAARREEETNRRKGQEQLFAQNAAEERERADMASTGSARDTQTSE